MTAVLAAGLKQLGYQINDAPIFDTLTSQTVDRKLKPRFVRAALSQEINLRYYDDGSIGLSLDETIRSVDIQKLLLFSARRRIILT